MRVSSALLTAFKILSINQRKSSSARERALFTLLSFTVFTEALSHRYLNFIVTLTSTTRNSLSQNNHFQVFQISVHIHLLIVTEFSILVVTITARTKFYRTISTVLNPPLAHPIVVRHIQPAPVHTQ